MNNTKHTAHYLVSSFLMSNRCLKPIYGLDAAKIAILRYIADSIDLHYKKHKSFHTKLYQQQIADRHFCTVKTLRGHLHGLIKKRLIRYEPQTGKFYLGKVFTGWVNITCRKDVGKNYLPLRSRYFLPTSNASNITNRDSHQNEGQQPVDNSENEPISIEQKMINAKRAEQAREEMRQLAKKIRFDR